MQETTSYCLFTHNDAAGTTNNAVRALLFIIKSQEIILLAQNNLFFSRIAILMNISQLWEILKHGVTAFPNIGKQ